MAWNPSQHSDQDNLRWCWLRAVEWGAWPLFLSQPIAPIILLLKGSLWAALVPAIIANVLWSGVRYRFVSVAAASWGAVLVHLKWVTIPPCAYQLWEHNHPGL